MLRLALAMAAIPLAHAQTLQSVPPRSAGAAQAQGAPADLRDQLSSNPDEPVAGMVELRKVIAEQLAAILRPAVAPDGNLRANPASNTLTISGRANMVQRVIRLARRIDQVGDRDVETIALQNASSTEVSHVVSALHQGTKAPVVVADESLNSVLISTADPLQRLRLRTMVVNLDMPLEVTGNTRVRYAGWGDAVKIARKLEELYSLTEANATSSGRAIVAVSQTVPGKNVRVRIWADPETNSLVITAPPTVMRDMMYIIDKLDVGPAP
jgi:general secretion pathway protein D